VSTTRTPSMLRSVRRTSAGSRTSRAFVPMALIVTLGLGVAGCGGSSKPAYCSDRTTLQNDANNVKSSVSGGDLSSLLSQVTTIKSDATALVNAAKTDFPSQTSAIKTSVDTLATAVNALPSSPSASQIASLAVDVASVVSTIKGFSDATSSTCG